MDESNGDLPQAIPITGVLDGRKRPSENPLSYEELPDEIRQILIERKEGRGRMQEIMSILEEKHVLTALLFIDDVSPVLKSDVYNSVSRSANMVHKLDDMRRIGLIQMYATARTNSTVVVITPKGKSVAKLVREMMNVIDGGGGRQSLMVTEVSTSCLRPLNPYLLSEGSCNVGCSPRSALRYGAERIGMHKRGPDGSTVLGGRIHRSVSDLVHFCQCDNGLECLG